MLKSFDIVLNISHFNLKVLFDVRIVNALLKVFFVSRGRKKELNLPRWNESRWLKVMNQTFNIFLKGKLPRQLLLMSIL